MAINEVRTPLTGTVDLAATMSTKKKDLLSFAMKRTSDRIFSQEIPSDVTVNVGGTSFSLHKFPLISRCGHIRKLVSESAVAKVPTIEITEIPGGAEAFELAAKFCYGINFEINTENIAKLRCAAEYLEMTEEYAVGNLVARTDAYINEVALKTVAGAVCVLHSSERLLPMAERVKLVSRCVDAIAIFTCDVGQFGSPVKPDVDWLAEDLTVLRIDLFRRVLIAMMARGLDRCALAPLLMLYAHKSLQYLDMFGKDRKKMEPRQQQRVVLETIVSLLPREQNAMPVSFLSTLLRAAMWLETTVACRLDLEKRIASQLGHAALDDLLIPSYFSTGDTLFDVDTVQRIMANFFESGMDEDRVSASPSDIERVTKLMESYLSEIASDRNLPVSKFVGLAELVPEQSRITEDGIYRAIDIYLKAHPALSDMERKKLCSVMDCQKLSRDACTHAAQNERLPVQTVVQVVYYEQKRLREAMDGTLNGPSALSTKLSPYSIPVPSDEASNLQKENRDLKLELVKMKIRLKEMEGNSDKLPDVSSPSEKWARKYGFVSFLSKKLGRIIRADGVSPQSSKGRTKPTKDRQHSIS